MLNISKIKIKNRIVSKNYSTLTKVESKKVSNLLLKLGIGIFGFIFILLFIPWTQNIRANGIVTALKPSEKPQTINSIIAGKIEKWYFQEGDYAVKGDTILKLSEVKDTYLNPDLLENTQKQVVFKRNTIESYLQKIVAQKEQLALLKNQKKIKIEQAKNKVEQNKLKVEIDSIAYIASITNFKNASEQLVRMDSLYKLGFKSLTDYEKRNLAKQQARADKVQANNKWLTSKNELINAKLDIAETKAYYDNAIAKLNADILSTLSIQLDAQAELNKLENEFGNYAIRNNQYFVLMPQDGYITKIYNSGVGEVIKEGAKMVDIMPKQTSLAIELYVKPIDLPLLQKEQEVRIQFDGWPAIVFSGWPNASYGTYCGKIYAIDQNLNLEGKFRVLVRQDSTEYAWPTALRFGAGTSNMVLLNNVPIWYEIWRNINGFPSDFYSKKEDAEK